MVDSQTSVKHTTERVDISPAPEKENPAQSSKDGSRSPPSSQFESPSNASTANFGQAKAEVEPAGIMTYQRKQTERRKRGDRKGPLNQQMSIDESIQMFKEHSPVDSVFDASPKKEETKKKVTKKPSNKTQPTKSPTPSSSSTVTRGK